MRNEESVLQQQCVKIFEMMYPRLAKRLWAIPNGGYRHIATAKRLKREGAKAGVPDLFLSIPRGKYGGMFIEMKTKTGKLSEEQKSFFDEHEGHYKCVVCRSVEQFLKEIRTYLKYEN